MIRVVYVVIGSALPPLLGGTPLDIVARWVARP